LRLATTVALPVLIHVPGTSVSMVTSSRIDPKPVGYRAIRSTASVQTMSFRRRSFEGPTHRVLASSVSAPANVECLS